MARLYHPDQDASLDAEVRYRDARLAYDVLRKLDGTDLTRKAHAGHSRQAGQGQTARQSKNAQRNNARRGEAQGSGTQRSGAQGGGAHYEGDGWYTYEPGEDGEFDFSDLLWEYGARKKIKERIPFFPFSFKKLPLIFRDAFKEVVTFGVVVRALLYVAFFGGFSASAWSNFGRLVFIFGPLPCFLLFAYYFPCDPREPRSNLQGSLLYSAFMGLLFLFVDYQHTVAAMLVTFFSLLILWCHPLELWFGIPHDGVPPFF